MLAPVTCIPKFTLSLLVPNTFPVVLPTTSLYVTSYLFGVLLALAVNVIAVPSGIAGHVNDPYGLTVLLFTYVSLLLVHLLNVTVCPSIVIVFAVKLGTVAP